MRLWVPKLNRKFLLSARQKAQDLRADHAQNMEKDIPVAQVIPPTEQSAGVGTVTGGGGNGAPQVVYVTGPGPTYYDDSARRRVDREDCCLATLLALCCCCCLF
ncbi:hypothetical protein BASA81_002631 [Batrachochytrium salamandrivorans]|nr:hypothetical protein BASA81_002631 [Batrachochytrium salamandrivorans]